MYYDCVAISQTGDPTGAYYRYAFVPARPGVAGRNLLPRLSQVRRVDQLVPPDHPRLRGLTGYGISVYALEKNKMLAGDPKARAVQFFLDSDIVPLNLIGDGLLPADIDGTRRPSTTARADLGTQDNDASYGATFDALNIFELSVKWRPSRCLATC